MSDITKGRRWRPKSVPAAAMAGPADAAAPAHDEAAVKVDGRKVRYRQVAPCFRCGERRPLSDGATCPQCLLLVQGLLTRLSTLIRDCDRALSRGYTPPAEALKLKTGRKLLLEARAALDGQAEAVGRVLALVERGPGVPGRGA